VSIEFSLYTEADDTTKAAVSAAAGERRMKKYFEAHLKGNESGGGERIPFHLKYLG
jgi:hypothetical protein